MKKRRSGVFRKVLPVMAFPRQGKISGKHRGPLHLLRVPCGNARARQMAQGASRAGRCLRIGEGGVV